MSSSGKLDRIAQEVLDNYISECLDGKRPIPPWLQDSLERIYSGNSKSTDSTLILSKKGDGGVTCR